MDGLTKKESTALAEWSHWYAEVLIMLRNEGRKRMEAFFIL
jgi:hypothetical protein